MSWKSVVEVAGESGKWHGNGLRFATKQEALDNARALMGRWMLVTAYDAHESTDPVNYQHVNGVTSPLTVVEQAE